VGCVVVVKLMVAVVAALVVVALVVDGCSHVGGAHKQWCMIISMCTQTLVNGLHTPRQYINPHISFLVFGYTLSLCVTMYILCTYLYTKRPVATSCNQSLLGL
jgi:ABC-type uncharacterized transport system permease subunit